MRLGLLLVCRLGSMGLRNGILEYEDQNKSGCSSSHADPCMRRFRFRDSRNKVGCLCVLVGGAAQGLPSSSRPPQQLESSGNPFQDFDASQQQGGGGSAQVGLTELVPASQMHL